MRDTDARDADPIGLRGYSTSSTTRANAQRRALSTLVVTQALGGVGVGAAVSVNALLAQDVSGSEKLAGLAQTSQVLGAAVVAALLAKVMSRHGRRPGLALGYVVGTVGAVLCLTAATVRSFPLMLLGSLLIGATSAANNQSRYAATDLAEPRHRGRDLSIVVWATTIGSVLGPNLSGPGATVAGWLHLPPMGGPYVFAAAGMTIAAGFMMWRLRPDPLLTARELSSPPGEPAAGHPTHTPAQALLDEPEVGGMPTLTVAPKPSVWRVIGGSRTITAAAAGLALCQAAMVSVMVMTPIHMGHGDASLEIIGLVISGHILGMYAFSPVVGWAVDRAGSSRMLAAGGLLLLASMALAGTTHAGASWRLGAGLMLLGVGWSFGNVAASTLLTSATPQEHRPEVQGATDMLTGFTAAAGGAVAGVVVGWLGFGWLTVFGAVLSVGVVLTAIASWSALRAEQPGPVSSPPAG